jgi:integrase
MTTRKMPPLGVRLTVDVDQRVVSSHPRYDARVRWTDPNTGRRHGVKRTFTTPEEAQVWVDEMRRSAKTGVDTGQSLAGFVESIGDRWCRTIDSTSTLDPYAAGLRLRVVPDLGHIPVGMLTAGLIDRAIDRWEVTYGSSTVKNTVAALVLVLDEAVREGVLPRNPAKDRARRKKVGRNTPMVDETNPRDLALPNVSALDRLVVAVIAEGGHQCWGDTVILLATTAMRISEVAGLVVGDVDMAAGLIHVRRQTYPGRGGLVTKTTKGRRRRVVPIIAQLRPTLDRLTAGRLADSRLVLGPRGGVITTATLRDATHWDEVVDRLNLGPLVRHGLRHTALTWMADSGVQLHVLQRVAGHQDPAVTSLYLHPDHCALVEAGSTFSAWWSTDGPSSPAWSNVVPMPAVPGNRR